MFRLSVILFFSALFAISCEKSEPGENLPPDSHISVESINLTGEDRLNSTVYLSWYGTDKDGFVEFYDLSLDNRNWERLQKQDSTFRFSISEGSDTADIDFYIRSIDNSGNIDPSPAYLRIPIRNTPPEIEFDEDLLPNDSELVVLSFRWLASDLDGDDNIRDISLKINDGDWVVIDRNKSLVSILPVEKENTGPTESQLFFDSDQDPFEQTINGLIMNGENTLYLKASDIAGAESEIDTSNVFFVKPKTSELLVVQGLPSDVSQVYRTSLNNQSISYDWLDYASDDGAQQPKVWEPTFTLLVSSYDRLLLFSNESLYTNPITKQDGMLLDFATPSLIDYLNSGGKMMISSAFAKNSDLTTVTELLPMDSVPSTGGQVRVSPDSVVYPLSTEYPELSPDNIVLGVDPFYPSSDAEIFYRGQISRLQGWQGPDYLAARRRSSGNVNQVFFSIQLHEFYSDPDDFEELLKKILVDDFNW